VNATDNALRIMQGSGIGAIVRVVIVQQHPRHFDDELQYESAQA